MLNKLLKYDLKWIFNKILIFFYILGIFFAIVGRGLVEIENSFILNIIGKICIGTSIAMAVNILINNLMRVWVRFTRNIYKDESYLTHTLPVEKKTIFLSKVLSAIITTVISGIVIVLCVAICYYSTENIEFIKTALEFVASTYNSSVVSFLLVTFVVFFLEIIFALLAGYLGIIIANKSNKLKTIKSVVFGFLAYMIPQIFTVVILFVVGLFNPDIMNLFNTTTTAFDVETIKGILYGGIVIYICYIVICYFVSTKLFEKGVNVD